MDPETKGKKCQRKIQEGDGAPRIDCPRAARARFRSSPLSGEPFPRAWSAARWLGNYSSEIVSLFRTQKTHRRTRGRHAAARCVQKGAQDRDARPAIPAIVRSRCKMSASDRWFNPRQDARSEGKHLEQHRVRSDMKETI